MRQFVLYIVSFGFFYFLYMQIPDQFYAEVLYYYGVVLLCAIVINGLAPLEHVVAVQNHLISSHADLEIIRGCDSAGALFLLISAILVFETTLRQKLQGLLLGVALVYTLNMLRVVALYFLVAYQREWFEFVHLYLAPTLILLIIFIFFTWWAIGCRNAIKSA
jgi:exosortase family protein XrtM